MMRYESIARLNWSVINFQLGHKSTGDELCLFVSYIIAGR